ncbi:hypothetical protein EV426DRAFT_34611 [Tirmania nivea]|nr:hypothetical protein EV426DRAFT_34611 [Tirmania nivea]
MPPPSTTQSTSHPTKRQNRSITTFLPATATATSTLAPLPGPIQASLQTVGMRVRKSVASGYKTKSTSFPALIYSDLLASTTSSSVYEDVPFASLSSSQESVSGNELKRRHDEDDDEEEECGEVEAPQQQQPRSAFDLLMANRHVAIPKSQTKRDARRRGWHKAVERKGGVGYGAGGLDVREVGGGEEEDFGDAGFLRPVGEMEMDVDV